MRIILSDDNVVAYFNPLQQYIPTKEELDASERLKKTPQVGKLYSLQGEMCDGFDMPKKVYEAIAIINQVNGIEVNSIVMKQVDGEDTTIFSLTKSDCKTLGIDFQDGLQLFPQGMEWKNVETTTNEEKEAEYNSNDLSTYPCDYHTHKIKRMCCKLHGFSITNNGVLITPNGAMSMASFIHSLRIRTRRYISGIAHGAPLSNRIVTQKMTYGMYPYVDPSTSSIYVEFDLETPHTMGGINPQVLRGKNFSDLFQVEWETYNDERIGSNYGVGNNGYRIRPHGISNTRSRIPLRSLMMR